MKKQTQNGHLNVNKPNGPSKCKGFGTLKMANCCNLFTKHCKTLNLSANNQIVVILVHIPIRLC